MQIGSRYYPTVDEALAVAQTAARERGKPLYVIKMKVEPSFRKFWPLDHHWRIGEEPPFHGWAGEFYHPRPAYWVIEPDALMPAFFSPEEKIK